MRRNMKEKETNFFLERLWSGNIGLLDTFLIFVSVLHTLIMERKMQDSFSIAIETPENIKTIKQYENQIEELTTQNFELKRQLSYYRKNGGVLEYKQIHEIEKIKQENRESIDEIEKYKKIVSNYMNKEQGFASREEELNMMINDLRKKDLLCGAGFL